MGEKRKKIVSLLLVFSLVALSGNLTAQSLTKSEKKGAKLRIQKNDGQEVIGELITVKKDSLLLLNAEINADITVLIEHIETITIVKKALGFQFMVYGALAGVLYGSSKKKTYKYLDRSQSYFVAGAILAATGFAIGSVAGLNKKIRIHGKSDTEIQKVMETLNKKARVPNFQ